MFHQKSLHENVIHEWSFCRDEAANHQLPIAVAFWIIPILSAEECSSLMQNLMQVRCSAYSVILKCDGYTVHMLTQWCLPPPLISMVKSIIVHARASQSTPLGCQVTWCCTNCSRYINNAWSFSGHTLMYTYLEANVLKDLVQIICDHYWYHFDPTRFSFLECAC